MASSCACSPSCHQSPVNTPTTALHPAGTGTVEACGEGAAKFSLGQRVVGAPFDSVERGCGTWQQYMVTSEASLVAVPEGVSDEAAAQVGAVGVRCGACGGGDGGCAGLVR